PRAPGGSAGPRRQRNLRPNGNPAAVLPACAELPAVDRDALAHPDEAVPAVLPFPVAAPVVDDLEQQALGAGADEHRGARGARVLENVGERFLDDAVGAERDIRG